MTEPNRAALAFASIIAGAAAGTTVSTLFVWLSWRNWSVLSVFGEPANLALAGSGLGVLCAMIVCWQHSRGLEETWRRAAMAVAAAFGAAAASTIGAVLSTYSSITSNHFVAAVLVPFYFAIVAIIWIMAARSATRNRLSAPAPASR